MAAHKPTREYPFKRASDGILRAIKGLTFAYVDPKEPVRGPLPNGKTYFVCTGETRKAHFTGYPICGRRAAHDPDRYGRPTRCGYHTREAIKRHKKLGAAQTQAAQGRRP